MGKSLIGPKTAALVAVLARLKTARESRQGICLKPKEVETLMWGMQMIAPTSEERGWLDARRRANG